MKPFFQSRLALRQRLGRWFLALTISGLHGYAQAQGAPDLRLVVGAAAGGPVDALARRFAAALQEVERSGRDIRVLNQPGSNGELAAERVMQLGANGTAILVGTTYPMGPHAAGLQPLAQIAEIPWGLFAKPASNGNGVLGTAHNDSIGILNAPVMANATGRALIATPYANTVSLIKAGENGEWIVLSMANVEAAAQQGLELLAAGTEEAARAAGVPSFAQRFPGAIRHATPVGIMVSPSMPGPMREFLQKNIMEAIQSPSFKAELERMRAHPKYASATEFSATLDELGRNAVRASDAGGAGITITRPFFASSSNVSSAPTQRADDPKVLGRSARP